MNIGAYVLSRYGSCKMLWDCIVLSNCNVGRVLTLGLAMRLFYILWCSLRLLNDMAFTKCCEQQHQQAPDHH
jgi:hypothetical protein